MARIKLFDIRWVSHTAGPSPVKNEFGSNCRVELFFIGCKKAVAGNPCPGCFNPALWKDIGNKSYDPKEMAQHLNAVTQLRHITIVGGEPLDQSEGLLELCEELRGWHKIVFTHYRLEDIPLDKQSLKRFLNNIDILIDGEYDPTMRIYNESLNDGLHNAVGSANQVIWDIRDFRKTGSPLIGYRAGDLSGISVDESGELIYYLKDLREYYELE